MLMTTQQKKTENRQINCGIQILYRCENSPRASIESRFLCQPISNCDLSTCQSKCGCLLACVGLRNSKKWDKFLL